MHRRTLLELRIAVAPGDLQQMPELLADLAERGPASLQQKQLGMVWRIIDEPAFAETADEQRRLAEDPTAFFRGRGIVAGRHGEDIYLLLWDTAEKAMTQSQADWNLTQARMTQDARGFPAMRFELNISGARRLRSLSEQHVNEPLAILIADRVYSAPVITGAIDGEAQISAPTGFTEEQINRLIPLLRGERPGGAEDGTPNGAPR